MTENSRENFIEALRLAAQSLEDAREPIDELNGRLDELTYYGDETAKLGDTSKETIEDALKLYRELPVWDWLDELRDKLRKVADEVEKGQLSSFHWTDGGKSRNDYVREFLTRSNIRYYNTMNGDVMGKIDGVYRKVTAKREHDDQYIIVAEDDDK